MSAKHDTKYHFVPLSDVFIKKKLNASYMIYSTKRYSLRDFKKRQNGHYATEALPWCNDRYPIE